jgi:hypothetical protein
VHAEQRPAGVRVLAVDDRLEVVAGLDLQSPREDLAVVVDGDQREESSVHVFSFLQRAFSIRVA